MQSSLLALAVYVVLSTASRAPGHVCNVVCCAVLCRSRSRCLAAALLRLWVPQAVASLLSHACCSGE
jgi:hypothetical protein